MGVTPVIELLHSYVGGQKFFVSLRQRGSESCPFGSEA
jgi:hypothetical protein